MPGSEAELGVALYPSSPIPLVSLRLCLLELSPRFTALPPIPRMGNLQAQCLRGQKPVKKPPGAWDGGGGGSETSWTQLPQ